MGETESEKSGPGPWTLSVAFAVMPLYVPPITVEPAATPVAKPEELIVAMETLPEAHVTLLAATVCDGWGPAGPSGS